MELLTLDFSSCCLGRCPGGLFIGGNHLNFYCWWVSPHCPWFIAYTPPHSLCLLDFHMELSSHYPWYTPGSVPLTFCGVIFGGCFAGSFSLLSVVYFLPAVHSLLRDSFPLLPVIYVLQIVSQTSLWSSLLVVAYCSGVEHWEVSSP